MYCALASRLSFFSPTDPLSDFKIGVIASCKDDLHLDLELDILVSYPHPLYIAECDALLFNTACCFCDVTALDNGVPTARVLKLDDHTYSLSTPCPLALPSQTVTPHHFLLCIASAMLQLWKMVVPMDPSLNLHLDLPKH